VRHFNVSPRLADPAPCRRTGSYTSGHTIRPSLAITLAPVAITEIFRYPRLHPAFTSAIKLLSLWGLGGNDLGSCPSGSKIDACYIAPTLAFMRGDGVVGLWRRCRGVTPSAVDSPLHCPLYNRYMRLSQGGRCTRPDRIGTRRCRLACARRLCHL